MCMFQTDVWNLPLTIYTKKYLPNILGNQVSPVQHTTLGINLSLCACVCFNTRILDKRDMDVGVYSTKDSPA